jgi:hypothetical protein
MELSSTFKCPCRPEFTYKNAHALAIHKKSKMHLAWETSQDVKDVRVKSKQYENEVERLKNRLIHRENVEAELLAHIRTLEESVAYWKKQSEGVYIN